MKNEEAAVFLSLMKFFRGFLLVRLSGYSPERFFNLCSNHNILVWDVVNKGGFYEFHISLDGFRRLKPLLKKTKTKVVILQRVGLPFFLYRYRRRKVFFAGIFCFLGLLFYLSSYVWLIDINGNSRITDERLLAFLKEQHVSFGAKIRKIDCKELEESIRSAYEDIIWVSVRLNGTRMIIDIKENLLPKTAAEEEKDNPPEDACDILSDQDAEIESIITRKGTPLVKAGDKVCKGDVLVASALAIYDDNSELSGYLYVTADADIIGQTEYAYQDSFPMQYTKKVPVGRPKTWYGIEIFSFDLEPFAAKDVAGEFYRRTESRPLSIAQNYYIPVVLKKTTSYACGYQNVTLSEEEAKERAGEKIQVFLKNLVKKGIQITGKNVMIDFNDDHCNFAVAVKARERIGRYKEAERLEITETERQTEHESD